MISPHEARSCQHLWVSVLAMAMRDIFKPAQGGGAHCPEHEQQRTLSWVGSRDFHRVCALAGKDGARVEAMIRRRLAEAKAGSFDPTPLMRGLLAAREGHKPSFRQQGRAA